MSTSVWIALLCIAVSGWVLVRVLAKPRRMARGGRSAGVYGRDEVDEPEDVDERRPAAGMIGMDMSTRGFLKIVGPEGSREEPLPDSPLGEGEFPMGVWVAPDHTLFAVGKQYTGQPGSDDGVVWRRDASGRWSTPHRVRGRVFGSIAGRSQGEVVIGTIGGIVIFDGAAWREVSLPYALMWKVWRDGDELMAQAWDGSAAFTVRGGAVTACEPREEPDRDHYAHTQDGVRYMVFDRSEELGERLELRDEMALAGRASRIG